MLRNVLSGNFVPHNSPSSIATFVYKVLEQIDGEALRASLADLSNSKPFESIRQYFYSAVIKVLAPTCMWMIPSVGRHYEMQRDSLDFYLDGDVKWGIKLSCETDKDIASCGRLFQGGQYSHLSLDQYVVLNFTSDVPSPRVRDHDSHLWHIVHDRESFDKFAVYRKDCAQPTLV